MALMRDPSLFPNGRAPSFQSEYYSTLSPDNLLWPSTNVLVVRSARDPNRNRKQMGRYRGHFAPGEAQTAGTVMELSALRELDPNAGVWKFPISPAVGAELRRLFFADRTQERQGAPRDRAALVLIMDAMARFTLDEAPDHPLTRETTSFSNFWNLFQPWCVEGFITRAKEAAGTTGPKAVLEFQALEAGLQFLDANLYFHRVEQFLKEYSQYCRQALAAIKRGEAPAPRKLARAGSETRMGLGVIDQGRVPSKTVLSLPAIGREEPREREMDSVPPSAELPPMGRVSDEFSTVEREEKVPAEPVDESQWLSNLGAEPDPVQPKGLQVPKTAVQVPTLRRPEEDEPPVNDLEGDFFGRD